MIVRESPKSGSRKPQPNWPPRSPHEAILSSPGARKRYEERRRERDISPSPMKRRPGPDLMPGLGDDEDEDEETLALQLKAIETKLKLKRLQKARQAEEEGDNGTSRPGTSLSARPSTAGSMRRGDVAPPKAPVEVPMSPPRKLQPVPEQKSPVRVMLGIDKGLRAHEVSLKRANSFHTTGRPGLHSRTGSRAGEDTPRVKSFSERMAESRTKEKEREEKQARIEKNRSHGFGFRTTDRDGASSRAASAMSGSSGGLSSKAPSALSGSRPTSSGRDTKDMPPPSRRGTELLAGRSTSDLKSAPSPRPSSNLSFRSDTTSRTSSSARTSATRSFGEDSSSQGSTASEVTGQFESYSGLHLRQRNIAHTDLARTLDGKTVYTVPQLLKVVKSPNYDPPDVENDFVVIGVIASQSAALNTKHAQKASKNEMDTSTAGKFSVIRLTDLKWELDLYLFDTGFSRFYKLTTGTLVAILNPDIMPPRNKDTGKFSLKLTSSDDTVLEIGTARDLDYCKALKKDGKECLQWVDKRKTEYCDFHINLQVEKARRGRMEVNSMVGFGPGMKPGGRGGKFKDDGPLPPHGRMYDKYMAETYYVTPGAGAAARLLDQDDFGGDVNRAETHRKRLAEKEKERELAKKLGEMGRGAGSDYMRAQAGQPIPVAGLSSQQSEDKHNLSDAAKSLLGKKAVDVSLSPVKRKRNAVAKEPAGWGAAFKRGLLLSPKKDEKQRETSPAKKKARFDLEGKGIREPGRDSLGGLDVGLIAAMDDDDDDGLDII